MHYSEDTSLLTKLFFAGCFGLDFVTLRLGAHIEPGGAPISHRLGDARGALLTLLHRVVEGRIELRLFAAREDHCQKYECFHVFSITI